MKISAILAWSLLLVISGVSSVLADPFGSGAFTFDIDFVEIGDAGNVADTAGSPNPAGSVAVEYRIGKFEISEDMIDKANALGGLGITHASLGANKPASSVTWFEAAQFVNWLNTSTGHSPAYKFDTGGNFQLWQSGDAGYDPTNLYRNSQARYVLPSVDEWYKAAYYDPTSGTYFDYPTASNTAPSGVASGTAANTAVIRDGAFTPPGAADVTQAGGLSPYGTMGQGGNVFEWAETDFDLLNDSTTSSRVIRGGDYGNTESLLVASSWIGLPPTYTDSGIGFRVASVPEPSSLVLAGLAGMSFLLLRRRKN